jgi:hypothetical protein
MAGQGKGLSKLVDIKQDIERVETHFGYIEKADQ